MELSELPPSSEEELLQSSSLVGDAGLAMGIRLNFLLPPPPPVLAAAPAPAFAAEPVSRAFVLMT